MSADLANGGLEVANSRNDQSSVIVDETRRWFPLCRSTGQVNLNLVDIAPSPTFRRIIALDDRMGCGVKMFGRMFVRRVVATADMPAASAQPEMHPPTAACEAFRTAQRLGSHLNNCREMIAAMSHATIIQQDGQMSREDPERAQRTSWKKRVLWAG